MGLIAPSPRAHHAGAVRDDVPPIRRAIVFQRPAMLRRSAGGNIRYALSAAGVPRAEQQRVSTNCSNWSASDACRTGRRAGCPAANSSGWRWRGRSRATRRAVSGRTDREPRSRRHQGDRGHHPRRQPARHQGRDGRPTILAKRAGWPATSSCSIAAGSWKPAPAVVFLQAPQTGEAKTFLAGELLV